MEIQKIEIKKGEYTNKQLKEFFLDEYDRYNTAYQKYALTKKGKIYSIQGISFLDTKDKFKLYAWPDDFPNIVRVPVTEETAVNKDPYDRYSIPSVRFLDTLAILHSGNPLSISLGPDNEYSISLGSSEMQQRINNITLYNTEIKFIGTLDSILE